MPPLVSWPSRPGSYVVAAPQHVGVDEPTNLCLLYNEMFPLHLRLWLAVYVAISITGVTRVGAMGADHPELSPVVKDVDSTIVLRGRVVAPSGKPVPDATVVALDARGQSLGRVNTDSAGQFSIRISTGAAVEVRASSFRYGSASVPVPSVQEPSTSEQTVNLHDMTLRGPNAALDTMQVRDRQHRAPQRSLGDPLPSHDGVAAVTGVMGRILPVGENSPEALAATLPGSMLNGAGGFVVFGLGENQQSLTLNGLAAELPSVPRDIPLTVHAATSPTDPSVGEFAAAAVQVEMGAGGRWSTRSARLSLAPPVAARDKSAFPLPTPAGAWQLGGSASGQVADGRGYYAGGIQFGRTASVLPSAFSEPSATRVGGVRDVASAVGIPTTLLGLAPVTQSGSLLARFDLAPTERTTAYLILGGALQESIGALRDFTAGPGVGAATKDRTAQAQLHVTRVSGRASHDLRLGMVQTAHDVDPYSELPGARVFEGSTFAVGGMLTCVLDCVGSDSSGGVLDAHLWRFGRDDLPTGPFHRSTIQLADDVTLLRDGAHRWMFGASLRRDAEIQTAPASLSQGYFTFNSIDALASSDPTMFTREFAGPAHSISESLASAYIGDVWRPTANVTAQLGLRADVAWPLGKQSASPALPSFATGFGATSWQDATLSPRISVTRTFGLHDTPFPVNSGDVVASTGRRGTLRFAYGRYVAPLQSSFNARLASTRNGVRNLVCEGVGVPRPDWLGFQRGSASPDACALAVPRPFAASNVITNYELLAPHTTGARTSRASLSASFMPFDAISADIEGVWSNTTHLIESIDQNLRPFRQLTLVEEGGRPVWSPSSAIEPNGAITEGAWRSDPAIGSVVGYSSSGALRSRQLIVSLESANAGGPLYWSSSYVNGYVEQRLRRVGAPTDGDPSTIRWTRGDYDVRHQFTFQVGVRSHSGASITLFARLHSGLPFTPLVAGDPNGDGIADDAAFIPDASALRVSPSDLTLAREISLFRGSGRACLTANAGSIARLNSCSGAWAFDNFTVQISSRAPSLLHLLEDSRISLSLTDPLGGLDNLLHKTSLHGWGISSGASDPVLLITQGFDPGSQRFSYAVNPHFGRTVNVANSFRAVFEVSVPLSPPREQQMLSATLAQLDRAQLTIPQRAEILTKRYRAAEANPVTLLVAAADTLALTDAQLSELRDLQDAYDSASGPAWKSFESGLAGSKEWPSRSSVLERIREAQTAAFTATKAIRTRARRELTPDQLRRISSLLRLLLDSDLPVMLREIDGGL